jgi:hypothetical protein
MSADLFPRITPLTLLPIICDQAPSTPYLAYIRSLLGSYGILLTKEQQAARVVRYHEGKRKKGTGLYDVELRQELSNEGHLNWNPSARPSWLLFEIENDILVRETQSKVSSGLLCFKQFIKKQKVLTYSKVMKNKKLLNSI